MWTIAEALSLTILNYSTKGVKRTWFARFAGKRVYKHDFAGFFKLQAKTGHKVYNNEAFGCCIDFHAFHCMRVNALKGKIEIWHFYTSEQARIIK